MLMTGSHNKRKSCDEYPNEKIINKCSVDYYFDSNMMTNYYYFDCNMITNYYYFGILND
jgi:hypothetical protein